MISIVGPHSTGIKFSLTKLQMTKVCILDYGSGNVRSVYNLLAAACSNVTVSNDVRAIQEASHIILPGVGSFSAAMRKIEGTLPMADLCHALFVENKPFLGICVGMQVMAESGLEFGENVGLGWIPGSVELLKTNGAPLPHIGWNNIRVNHSCPLLDGLENEPDFYFVHSYAMRPSNSASVVATTEYGQEFCSVVHRGNLFGVQFHPEKSQKAGKKLIENFLSIE